MSLNEERPYLDFIDCDTPGPRADVTPLFAEREAFEMLVADLAEPFTENAVDAVAGIDALGFILGTALSVRLGVGFVAVRKGGKLPVETEQVEFVDYSGEKKTLELRPGAVRPEMRVLLVDEWVETGAQALAASELIERQGGQIVGLASIHIDDTPGGRQLRERYTCHTVS